MKKELVSVMIPCYNAEKFLDKCLFSLLNQTYPYLEVIIVNDGSSDKSEDLINSYIEKFDKKSKKLVLINQNNHGQAYAINTALKYVTGDYIMWQDADDWYELDAVENLLKCLKEKHLNIVRGEVANRYENKIDEIAFYSKSIDKRDKNVFDDYIFEHDSYCYAGIWLVKMEYFDKCIKNREIYLSRAGQNWQLILPLTFNEKCGYLDNIVYNCRIVNSSHSHSAKKISDLLKRCDDHKDVLFNVISNIDKMEKRILFIYKYKICVKYLKKKLYIVLSYFAKRIIKKLGEKIIC